MKSLFVWGLTFFLLHPHAVFAATTPSPTTTLTYDVYAGGIHALDALLTIRKGTKQYTTTLSAGTRGFLQKVANWSGNFSSNGMIINGHPRLLTHSSASTWKGKTETKTFKYDSKGNFLSYKVSEGGKDKTPKDIDKSLAIGSMDNLTATLHLMMGLPKSQLCNGNSLVFDGDRSYRLIFADTKPEILTKSDYNFFSGSAVSCTVEVKPEKGKWRKKPRGWLSIQEQGRQKGSLPTIWFGQVAGQPEYYVPVKIRVKTDYGTLFMHLTSVKNQ